MIAAVAGDVPVKRAPLLPTMRLLPGVRTPRKQVHHDSLSLSKSAVAVLTPEVQTPQKEVHHYSVPPSKAVVPPPGRPRQHPTALALAQCYSTVRHLPAIHCRKRTSAPSQNYRRSRGLAAAAATALYCGRRCTSAPSQSYRRGGGLAAAAATALYCGRRCPSAPSQSYRRGGGLAAAAATALYCRRRCSVARTVSHDNYDYRCIAVETTGYAPRTSSPRARLVGIARTTFPKPGQRNVAPVAVAADKANAAVGDDCRVAHKIPSSSPFYLLEKQKHKKCTNIPCAMCFQSRRPCPPTSAFAVYKSIE